MASGHRPAAEHPHRPDLRLYGGNADPLSNLVNTVTAPVRSGIAAAADWAEGIYSYVFHYGEIQQQMEELEQENAELRKKIRQGEAASQENEQLRELLNLQAKREDFVFESAKVTARSTDNWRSTLTLSKGSNAGVEKGTASSPRPAFWWAWSAVWAPTTPSSTR